VDLDQHCLIDRSKRGLAETQQNQAQHQRRLARNDDRVNSKNDIAVRNQTGGSAIVAGAGIAGAYG
jgi:hypothetical protein